VSPTLSEIKFPLKARGSQNWSSDASSLLDIWNNSTQTATLFVDPPDIGVNTPSIGVVFSTLQNSSSAQITADINDSDVSRPAHCFGILSTAEHMSTQ
jgi:hypothetical protein